MLIKGSVNLADEELLAVLLGTGSTKQGVSTLSARLLQQFP
ncbi:MAG TPA: UPF0758 domain-containing protein [Patescibacteria group bacterium]